MIEKKKINKKTETQGKRIKLCTAREVIVHRMIYISATLCSTVLYIHISSKTRGILKKVVLSRGSVVFKLIIKET